MPRKIEFNVIYASSEDERHSCLELNVHGPTVRGWQSARKCGYPQELILRLHAPAKITRIQVLAHQYLIPEKLEIWTTKEENASVNTSFNYLGYITLSDNESTLYKSRELKSVALPETKALSLKLRLHKPHQNTHNVHEQVGLIAINIIGEPCTQDINNQDAPYNPHYTSPYDDLAFEMYVDREVAKIIRQMENKKLQAAEEERFEYASKLKVSMEILRKAGERLGKYELEKKYAIALEDYDKAKAKKAQAQHYRQEVYESLEVNDLLEVDGPLEKNNVSTIDGKEPASSDAGASSNTVVPEDILSPPRLVVPPNREGALSPTGPPHQPPVSPLHQKPHSPEITDSPPNGVLERQINRNTGSLRRKTKSAGPSLRSSYEAYEERTIPALRHSHTNEFTRECHLESEVKVNSKLNDREKKQAALPITVFGMEVVEKFYSKQFMDKEEGLMMLKEELKKFDPEVSKHSANKTARAAILLLHRALRDKVFSVYSLAAQLIRIFFSEFATNRVSSTEIARSVDRLLPELLTKSGDTTPRIHNMAVHTILSMADCQCVRELHIIPVHLSRPILSSTHQRLALSRLEMVEQLILNHGISTDKQRHCNCCSGLTCRTLSDLGSSGLLHPAEAVRKVSERILVLVYKVNPRLVRKQLPPDDDITRRNLLYRQLYHEFDRIDLQRKKEMESTQKSTTTPTCTKSIDNNVTNSTKSPSRASPVQISTESSTSVTSPSDNSTDHKGDKCCIFCLSKGQGYSEEGLNIHYWRTCPMLTRCELCKQVVEISHLNSHLLSECDQRNDYVKCDTCKQAIVEKSFSEHSKDDSCTRPVEGYERCPLCRILVNKNKWKDHLMGENPCPNNPRNKSNKTCTKSPSKSQNLSGKITSPTGRDY
ncbi:centrosomal protein of 104 kDa isoform X1 [Cotesia glomerata]|uniref:centrosomal protein of 104 kDa isoform X1 n=1 Tax=Cotesia glomerata TaxID=32391 RepID=UPI001D0320C6|nr:centrosomal protein of 104 kDa isoform X1 [Cotesia glomerata]